MDTKDSENKFYLKSSYQSVPLQDLPHDDEQYEPNDGSILRLKRTWHKRFIAGVVLLCLATLLLAFSALNPTQLGSANTAPSVAPTKAPWTEYFPAPILPPSITGETGFPSAAPTLFPPLEEEGISDLKPTLEPLIRSFAPWIDQRLPSLRSFMPSFQPESDDESGQKET